jgi:hypothetical protein
MRSWHHLGGPWALLGASQWNQPAMLASAITHALGNTATAASVPRSVTGADSRRCAAHPHGTHNAASPTASTASNGPALGSSQYCVASTYPERPHHARIPPSRAVGAARTTSRSGVKPIQASHHHDGAGKANAGSAPTTKAAARPGARRVPDPSWDCRDLPASITAADEDPAEHETGRDQLQQRTFPAHPAQRDHDQPGPGPARPRGSPPAHTDHRPRAIAMTPTAKSCAVLPGSSQCRSSWRARRARRGTTQSTPDGKAFARRPSACGHRLDCRPV